MNTIVCPYDSLTVKVAMLSAAPKFEKYIEEHNLTSLDEAIDMPLTKADMNVACANYHGIPLETYINSPNYVALSESFEKEIISRFTIWLKDKVGLSDKRGLGHHHVC